MSILEMAFRDEIEYLQSLLTFSKKIKYEALTKNLEQRIEKVNTKIKNISK